MVEMKAVEKIVHQSVASRDIRRVLESAIPWAFSSLTGKIQQDQTNEYKNYKGQRGRIGVIGGSRDYTGAPYFAAISAMRLGADLSYVICTKDASPVIKSYSPELIVIPLLDSDDYDTEIECTLSRLHSVVVGPGLGRDKNVLERTLDLIQRVRKHNLPLVIDADGLLLVNSNPKIISGYTRAVLTPNRIELERLFNSVFKPEIPYNVRRMSQEEILILTEKCARDLGVTVMAKGQSDLIVSPSQKEAAPNFVLKTSAKIGSSRRCGGQGDLLSGMTATFLHWFHSSNTNENENITTNSDVKTEPNRKAQNPCAWSAYLAGNLTRRCNELAYAHDGQDGFLLNDMIKHICSARNWLVSDFLSLEDVHEQNTAQKIAVPFVCDFSADEVARYSRQMMMPEIGAEGQKNLKKSSVLIIGCGGLGCPAAAYLAAAGIGTLAVVDHDYVEMNNLHRQILHKVSTIGHPKTDSIVESLQALNPEVKYIKHNQMLTRENAVDLIEKYDIILDATDNLMSRYMISDACAVAKKPLVSGAALKLDGQLTIYGYDQKTPCFRCLFPQPPPSDSVRNCSDTGVLGVIPGIIGCLQALEAIKIAAGLRPAYAGRMLLLDGSTGGWRNVQLGQRKSDCRACGSNKYKLDRHLMDYEEFCGTPKCARPPEILGPDERVTAQEYKKLFDAKVPHVLLDVRPTIQTEVSHLAHAITIPVLQLHSLDNINRIEKALDDAKTNKIFIMCRRGIASQTAVRILKEIFEDRERQVEIKDIKGGSYGWAKQIDPKYPVI